MAGKWQKIHDKKGWDMILLKYDAKRLLFNIKWEMTLRIIVIFVNMISMTCILTAFCMNRKGNYFHNYKYCKLFRMQFRLYIMVAHALLFHVQHDLQIYK